MNKKGMSTIILVITISVVTLLMATTLSFVAFGNLEITSDYFSSKKAHYLAESCFEDSLRQIQKNNFLLLDNKSLSIDDGLCIISIGGSSNSKTIEIEANIESYYKKIDASITIDSRINLDSYNIK